MRSIDEFLNVKLLIWFPENALVSMSEMLEDVNEILAADGNESGGILEISWIFMNSAMNYGCCNGGDTFGLKESCSNFNVLTDFMLI